MPGNMQTKRHYEHIKMIHWKKQCSHTCLQHKTVIIKLQFLGYCLSVALQQKTKKPICSQLSSLYFNWQLKRLMSVTIYCSINSIQSLMYQINLASLTTSWLDQQIKLGFNFLAAPTRKLVKVVKILSLSWNTVTPSESSIRTDLMSLMKQAWTGYSDWKVVETDTSWFTLREFAHIHTHCTLYCFGLKPSV